MGKSQDASLLRGGSRGGWHRGWGWQLRGRAMPSWHCKDSEQLPFPGVLFRSFSLSGYSSGLFLLSSGCGSEHTESTAALVHSQSCGKL